MTMTFSQPRSRARLERVLASPALRIVQKLIHAGLPHIDIGAARQMIANDLSHRPRNLGAESGGRSGGSEQVHDLHAPRRLVPLRRDIAAASMRSSSCRPRARCSIVAWFPPNRSDWWRQGYAFHGDELS